MRHGLGRRHSLQRALQAVDGSPSQVRQLRVGRALGLGSLTCSLGRRRCRRLTNRRLEAGSLALRDLRLCPRARLARNARDGGGTLTMKSPAP